MEKLSVLGTECASQIIMMSHKIYIGIWIVAVFVALFLFARFGGQLLAPILENPVAPSDAPQNFGLPKVGEEAPYFELTDLSGNRVRLADFANTPLLLTFWSTTNSDARDQIKILDDWTASHPMALFRILTVNSLEEKSIVKSFITRGAYTAATVLDREGAVGAAYGAQTLPVSFFIDRNGIIRSVYIGLMSQKMIAERSEQMFR
ncbi:MAG: TlpA disulfide reductase family protein [bacterium]|nr:TlpA disulfide reductase family protein [bacterium]